MLASASSYRLGKELVFEAGESYLGIVNALLDAAGFASAEPDEYGRVVMREYVEPSDRAPAWSFESGSSSIMAPQPEVSRESSANVVRLYHEDDEESLWASASNVDPSSPSSLPSRLGIESTVFASVGEIEGETQAARIAYMKSEAEKRLRSETSDVEHVLFTCPLVPVKPGDAVSIEYPGIGLSWSGTVSSMSVSLDAMGTCSVDARRFLRPSFEAEVEGGAL